MRRTRPPLPDVCLASALFAHGQGEAVIPNRTGHDLTFAVDSIKVPGPLFRPSRVNLGLSVGSIHYNGGAGCQGSLEC